MLTFVGFSLQHLTLATLNSYGSTDWVARLSTKSWNPVCTTSYLEQTQNNDALTFLICIVLRSMRDDGLFCIFCFIIHSVFSVGAWSGLQTSQISTRTFFTETCCSVSGSCLYLFFSLHCKVLQGFSIETHLCLMQCCPRAWRWVPFDTVLGPHLDWIHLTILCTEDMKFSCLYLDGIIIIKIDCRSLNFCFFVSLFRQGTVQHELYGNLNGLY